MNSKIAFLLLGLSAASSIISRAQGMDVSGPLPSAPGGASPEQGIVTPSSPAFDWKIQPKVGQRFDLRLFHRIESLGQTPRIKGTFGTGRKPTQTGYIARTKLVTLAKVHFVVEVLSVTREDWKARFTFLDSSCAAIEPRPSEIGLKTLARDDSRFSHSLQGASVTVVCSTKGQLLRYEGLSAWEDRIERTGLNGMGRDMDGDLERCLHPVLLSSQSFQETMRSWLEGVPTKPVTVGESWTYPASLFENAIPQYKPSGTRKIDRIVNGTAMMSENVPIEYTSPAAEWGPTAYGTQFTGRRQTVLLVSTTNGIISRMEQRTTLRMQTRVEQGAPAAPQFGPIDIILNDIIACELSPSR